MLGRLTMLLLAALLLAACGTDDEGATTTGADPATTTERGDASRTTGPGEPDELDPDGASNEEQAEATLRVELRNVGAKDGAGLPVPDGITCTRSLPATCRETIECPVAEDGSATGRRICAWLQETGAGLLLEEPPPSQVCTEVYGGPEVATVTGTIDGQPVDATFSREDGCAIARFDAVSPLWTGAVDPEQADGVGAGGFESEPEPRIVDDPPEAFELERDE